MKALLRNNSIFYLLFVLFLVLSMVLLFSNEELILHKSINRIVGNPFLNSVFKYLTLLGDGYMVLIMVLVISFYNVRWALIVLLSYLVSGGITQLLKNFVFTDMHRPFFFVSYEGLQLNLIQDVKLYINNSFPSGHATTAFSFFFCMSNFVEKKSSKIFLFLLAALTAFSRVYLSQHFLKDILAGGCIAIIVTTLFLFLFLYRDKINKNSKWNQGIIQLLSASKK